MKISYAVMMHPTREKYKDYLLSKLGDIPIIMDRGKGVWDTARRAWLSYDKNADYHLVVQDDAIVGKDFKERLEKEIRRHPNCAINLYFGNRKRLYKIAEKELKNGGVRMDWLSWAVAVCLPRKIIEGMVGYCDNMKILENHDDTRISHYLLKIGMGVWYPLPSLVDHRWQEPSLIESNEGVRKRHAIYFIGE